MARPVNKEAKNLGYAAITIRLDQDTIDKLDEHCKDKKMVRSELVRDLILNAIKN